MQLRDRNGLTEQEFLEQYDPGDYARPSLSTDVVILTVGDCTDTRGRRPPEKELRVLLIRRGGHPHLHTWALPGGFVRPGERLGAAAQRELREETGVDSGYLEQLQTFGEPGRDPRAWVVSCAYMALVDSGRLPLKAGDDAADARWFSLTDTLLEETKSISAHDCSCLRLYRMQLCGGDTALSAVVAELTGRNSRELEIIENDGLAFDHAEIIACAVHRLRGKLAHTDLALQLMPEFFSLDELQRVYEAVLGRSLNRAAFGQSVSHLVRKTGRYAQPAGRRPFQWYRRNWEGDLL